MPVVTPPQSAPGKKNVHEALGRRMHPQGLVRSLHGRPRIGAALPLYRIDVEEMAQPPRLADARKVGFGYPVVGGKVPGLALQRRHAGRLRHAGLVEGTLPLRLLRAAAHAEKALKSADQEFQPRLLEVPALHIFALWLFAPPNESRFILLTHSLVEAAPRLRLHRGIQSHIDAASTAVMKTREMGRERATPTVRRR